MTRVEAIEAVGGLLREFGRRREYRLSLMSVEIVEAIWPPQPEATPYPHGLIQTIRGMCTDEVPYSEVDRALVQLDEMFPPQPVLVTDEMAEELIEQLCKAWKDVELTDYWRARSEESQISWARAALEAAQERAKDRDFWKAEGAASHAVIDEQTDRIEGLRAGLVAAQAERVRKRAEIEDGKANEAAAQAAAREMAAALACIRDGVPLPGGQHGVRRLLAKFPEFAPDKVGGQE